jgi:hypothetical protein
VNAAERDWAPLSIEGRGERGLGVDAGGGSGAFGENRRNKSPGGRAALEQHGELAVYGDKQCEKSASWQEKGILG